MSVLNWEGTAAIAYVGVLPVHRGHGCIRDLILAGMAAAERPGFTSVRSDVDVHNEPTIAAMEATGHHASATDWRVWHHVGSVESIIARERAGH